MIGPLDLNPDLSLLAALEQYPQGPGVLTQELSRLLALHMQDHMEHTLRRARHLHNHVAQMLRRQLQLQALLAGVSVKIVHDVGVVEVRSFLGTRGAIVRTLLDDFKKRVGTPDFVLCMGDSSVDEPMFA